MTKILMCPPDYFSISYAINPWMKVGENSDPEKAKKQWETLKETIEQLGAKVEAMPAQPGLPDIVFTANAALVYKNNAVISRFKFKERIPEEKFYAEWFEDSGYNVTYLPIGMSFEGAGDALFLNDTLFSGYVPRTDIHSHTLISKLLKIRVLSLELRDSRFYHLDTCFCPLTDGYLLYYPDAFDDYGNKVIENNVSENKRIKVSEEEACMFSCNAVNVDKSIIMNKTTSRLRKEIENKGFTLYEVDMSEFLKSGGSCKCLTLKLD